MLRSTFNINTPHYNALDNGSKIHSVQIKRNKLAHQKDEYTNDGKMVLHDKSGPEEYDFNSFTSLRKELLEAISDIKSYLS